MDTKVNQIFTPDRSIECRRPLFMVPVSAGFPSPAEDYLEGKLDLNSHLIKHPAATFFVRVTGDSMIDAGIHSGDLVIVDRALEPVDGNVVIAVINGELTVKRIRRIKDRLLLIPDNKNYEALEIDEEMAFEVWGVVTHVIHAL